VPADATSCQSCGTGVLGSKTDRITGYNVSTGLPISIAVQTSADDCCECAAMHNFPQLVHRLLVCCCGELLPPALVSKQL
jgi:hypothetical protein